ncbi:MAG TPA: hypothetical protein VF624_15870 [Tepidisphaeraceae bacterium]|jgi:hypothetical protein
MVQFPDKLNATFRQSGNACGMAAYAVICNYFCGSEYFDPFEAYCEHFGMRLRGHGAEAEFTHHASTYRDNLPWSARILALHSVSMDPFFVRARQSFWGEFFPSTGAVPDHLIKRLADEDALFMAGIHPPGGMVHVVTVGRTEREWIVKDTNEGKLLRLPTGEINVVINRYGPTIRWTDGVVYTAFPPR